MRGCGIWAREVAMGSLPRESEIILKDIGSMIKDRGRGLTFSLKRTRFLLGSGLMMPPKQEYTPKLRTLLPLKLKGKSTSPTPMSFLPLIRSASKTLPQFWKKPLKR